MKKFNDRKSTGGFRGNDRKGPRGGSGGGYGRSDDRDDRPRMHSAVCSECDARCEVPFKPNGRKPVLCSDCFEGGDRDERPAFKKKFAGAPKPEGNFEVVKQLKALNDKMEKLIKLMTEFDEEEFEDEELENDDVDEKDEEDEETEDEEFVIKE